MKRPLLCALLIVATTSQAMAAEVISAQEDTSTGKVFGGISGLMVGAIGGPIGAVAGALVGVFGGSAVQESAGLSENAYVVENDDGSLQRVRTPGKTFAPGDQVRVEGIRLVRE